MSRRRRALLVFVATIAILALGLRWLSQPQRVAAIVMNQAGSALGLEITARGQAEYRLRGTPMLVLRDVSAREPGAAYTMLNAKRLYIALPWSTLRAAGDDLTATRIEFDEPRLQLPALQHWLATRPPSKPRLPTLTHGLQISDGTIINDDWRIDGIHADVPVLSPTLRLRARLRGRYLDAPLTIPVDLVVSMVHPEALINAATTGFATRGTIAIERGKDWRLPATVQLSGPLRFGKDDLRITPAHLGVAATYEAGDTRVPFALGLHGPLRFDEATWTLQPAGAALRGRGDGDGDTDPIPHVDAHGTLELGHRLLLQLQGEIAQWPTSWPALPPPIGQSSSPLPFALGYDGASDLSNVTTLKLRRDDTRFDGRFRLPEVLDWISHSAGGAPLPPLSGTLVTPHLEISGARVEGVQIEFGDGSDMQ
ncbi:AsmA family protein [Lysobacter fragariae]